MRTSQSGDRVQVHYVKRFSDGTVRSSRVRGDEPLEMTIGVRHPRLPGVEEELAGLEPGGTITVTVPAERAFGLPKPTLIRRVSRDRFRPEDVLIEGGRLQMRTGERSRMVRIVKVRGRSVVVDANHPRCGQAVVVDVELVSILVAEPEQPASAS